MGLEYLLRPFEEGELITTDLIEMLYEFDRAPLEQDIAAIVGPQDGLRRSHYSHPVFWTAYTANDGMTTVDLTYQDFGRTDDCDIDINILTNGISALIYRQALKEFRISAPPAARGGLHLEYREGRVTRITYWSQLDKQGSDDSRQLNPQEGIAGAYAFLKNRCEEERDGLLKRTMAQAETNLDDYLTALPLTEN